MASPQDEKQAGKKRIIIMSVVLIVLGAIAAGVAWYMSTIEEFTPTDTNAYTFDTAILCEELVAEVISGADDSQNYYSADETKVDPLELATGDELYISAVGQEIPTDAATDYEIIGYELTINSTALNTTAYEETADSTWTLTPTSSDPASDDDSDTKYSQTSFTTFLEDTFDLSSTEVLSNYNIYRTLITASDYAEDSTLRVVAKVLVNTPDDITDEVTCAEVFLKTSSVVTPDDEDPVVIDDTVDDTTDDTSDDTTDDTPDDTTTPDDDATDPTAGDTSTTSDLYVSVTGTTCVERVAPDDISSFTITITNNDTDSEEVVTVVDKLPLGFTYTAGSTKINGEVQNDTLVTVTQTGDSQDLTWDPDTNWTIEAGGTLIIQYSAVAGEDALTGSVQNEVVVTPLNTPVNAANLRSELVFTVAQNCENPETGILDSTLGRIAVGLVIIMLGGFIYYSNSGIALSNKIMQTSAYTKSTRSAELFGLKLTNPRKYFEEKIKDKTDK